jgi:hypothetical protein
MFSTHGPKICEFAYVGRWQCHYYLSAGAVQQIYLSGQVERIYSDGHKYTIKKNQAKYFSVSGNPPI